MHWIASARQGHLNVRLIFIIFPFFAACEVVRFYFLLNMMVAGLPNNQIHKSDIADEFYQRRAYRNHLKMSFVSEIYHKIMLSKL